MGKGKVIVLTPGHTFRSLGKRKFPEDYKKYSELRYGRLNVRQNVGVSAYELSKLIPENFKGSLPSIDEIESELQKDVND